MKYLAVALLCCLALNSSGQKIQWGQLKQKLDKNTQISQVIGKTSMGIYTILTDVRRPAVLPPILQRFNADLELEKQTILRFLKCRLAPQKQNILQLWEGTKLEFAPVVVLHYLVENY